jgi:hypothetical protein
MRHFVMYAGQLALLGQLNYEVTIGGQGDKKCLQNFQVTS